MKKIFVFCLFLIFSSINSVQAQLTMHKTITVGYAYQNQSFGEIGGKLLFLKSDDVIYRLGASALMGVSNSKFAILPKVQGDVLINFEKNVDLYHSYYFLAGAEITTKYAAPKIGMTLFGLLDLSAGYAFSLDKQGINEKELKGVNVNLTFNIPLVLLHDLTH